MAVDRIRDDLEAAMRDATFVMRQALNAASTIDEVGEHAPELRERLSILASQMYALADVARDAERELARVHAEWREAAC